MIVFKASCCSGDFILSAKQNLNYDITIGY